MWHDESRWMNECITGEFCRLLSRHFRQCLPWWADRAVTGLAAVQSQQQTHHDPGFTRGLLHPAAGDGDNDDQNAAAASPAGQMVGGQTRRHLPSPAAWEPCRGEEGRRGVGRQADFYAGIRHRGLVDRRENGHGYAKKWKESKSRQHDGR